MAEDAEATWERAHEARQKHEFQEAHALYATASEQLQRIHRTEQACEALLLAADCAGRSGEPEQTSDYLYDAISLAKHRGLKQLLSRALGDLGSYYVTQGRVVEGAASYQEALEVAEDVDDDKSKANHLGNLGLLAQARGDLDDAKRMFINALDIQLSLRKLEYAARLLVGLGEIERDLGDRDAARAALAQALDLCAKSKTRLAMRTAAQARVVIGRLVRVEGDVVLARAQFDSALKLAKRSGAKQVESEATMELGHLHSDKRDRSAARLHYSTARDILGDGGSERHQLAADIGLAKLAIQEGRLAEGAATLQRAAAAFERLKQTRAASDVYCLLGQLSLTQGDLQNAAARVEQATVLAERSKCLEGQTRCEALHAALALAGADFTAAEGGFRKAQESFSAMECPHDEAVCILGLAEVNLYVGHPLDSQALAADAAALFRRIGAAREQLVAEAMVARAEFNVSPTPRFRESWLAAAKRLVLAGAPAAEVENLQHLAASDLGSNRSRLWRNDVRAKAEAMGLRAALIAVDVLDALAAGEAAVVEQSLDQARTLDLHLLVTDIERWRCR